MVETGQVYRHYKGGKYRILQLATEVAEVGESYKKVVVYQNIDSPDKVWVRSLDIFDGYLEKDGQKIKRFTAAND